MAPIPAYMPAPVASRAPQTPTPTPMWQSGQQYTVPPMPTQTRTPYPTPFLPGDSRPMLPMDPSQDLGYQQWLAQRGLPSAFSQSGQQAQQQSIFAPVQQMAEKKATGWLEDQGKSALDDIFFSGSGGSGAIPSGSGASDVLGGLASPTMPGNPAGLPTIANAEGLPALAGESSLMSVGLPAGVALATILAGRSGLNMLRGKQKNWKDASLVDNAGRVALATGTFGLSEVANKFFGGHKTTRERAKGNTTELLKKYTDDPEYQNFVKGMREQFNSAPPDPSKPYAGGKYRTWDEYKKAGLEAGDLTGVKGNLDLGQEYTRLTPEQKKAFTQQLIDGDFYHSSKGEVEVKDLNRARKILQSMTANGFKPIPTDSSTNGDPKTGKDKPSVFNDPNLQKLRPITINGATQQSGKWVDKDGNPVSGIDPGYNMGNRFVPDQVQVQRSNTRSPGIDKNGKRISYGGR
jgi:hypothetical protein